MSVVAPWELRFEAFVCDDFGLAADRPDHGVVAAGGVGPHQLHAWDRRTGDLRTLTDSPAGVLAGWISADGAWVYYLDDDGGTEEGHLVRVNFDGGTPERVDASGGPAGLFDLVAFGDQIAFTLARAGQYEHRVAKNSVPGSRLIAKDNVASFIGGFVDQGRTVVVSRYLADGGRDTQLVDVATGGVMAQLGIPGFALIAYLGSPVEGDRRLLAESNETGFRRPFVWDPEVDTREPIPVDGMAGEVRPIAWSPDAQSVLLLQTTRAEMHLHLQDLATGARRRLPLPAGAITGLPISFATEFGSSTEVLTLWQDGTHPRSIVSIPLDGRPPSTLLGSALDGSGHPWRNVTFPSADGTPIQGWLSTPDGPGPFRAVVDVHGGPGVAQFDEFLPHLQAFVDSGFAVLSVNYRSSGTFGREFEHAIQGHPGELEVDDLAAAHGYLVGEGIARSGDVLLEGWSYGGYLTLMGLGRRPDLWAGGICGVGIGDTPSLMDEAVEDIRQMFIAVFGGTPDELPGRYVAASPMSYVEAVDAPLLVIHGRDDGRCPAGQMERYLDRMAELDKDVTTEWFSAGHLGGVANP
ncbi:MAG: prolyl oligopeptidase family serine peptidase, partial [Candidatus Limnocylindrales bacterium]